MPSGVFKPYAGVSTAILFFTKTNSGGTKNVWFYDMKADGLSLDDKRNLQLDEETFELCFTDPKTAAKKVGDKCDIPNILLDWQKIESRTQSEAEWDRTTQSFLVPKSEIKENDYDLSINRYKETVYEEVEYENPTDLITQIKELDSRRNIALDSLEKMMQS